MLHPSDSIPSPSLQQHQQFLCLETARTLPCTSPKSREWLRSPLPPPVVPHASDLKTPSNPVQLLTMFLPVAGIEAYAQHPSFDPVSTLETKRICHKLSSTPEFWILYKCAGKFSGTQEDTSEIHRGLHKSSTEVRQTVVAALLEVKARLYVYSRFIQEAIIEDNLNESRFKFLSQLSGLFGQF